MRVIGFAAAAAVFGLVTGAAVAATPGKRLEVLGLHHRDTLAAAETTLSAGGFRFQRSGMGDDACARTIGELQSIAARNGGRLDYGMVRCERSYRDGQGRSVRVTYVVTLSGYVLSRASYAMQVPGGLQGALPQIEAKWGKGVPSRGVMGQVVRFGSPAEPTMAIFVKSDVTSPTTVIMNLQTPSEFADDEAAMKAVTDAGARRATGDRLKL